MQVVIDEVAREVFNWLEAIAELEGKTLEQVASEKLRQQVLFERKQAAVMKVVKEG